MYIYLLYILKLGVVKIIYNNIYFYSTILFMLSDSNVNQGLSFLCVNLCLLCGSLRNIFNIGFHILQITLIFRTCCVLKKRVAYFRIAEFLSFQNFSLFPIKETNPFFL
jgi:hypothetical protein